MRPRNDRERHTLEKAAGEYPTEDATSEAQSDDPARETSIAWTDVLPYTGNSRNVARTRGSRADSSVG